MGEWRPMKKIERQLLIYHLFIHNAYVSFDTVKYYLHMQDNQLRTFYRDLEELNDAGLITTSYDAEEKGYKDSGAGDIKRDVPQRYLNHLSRLNRVGRLMQELYQDDIDEDMLSCQVYDKEWWLDNMEPDDYIDVKSIFSVKDCYKELFPQICDRTMQRDFKLLCQIGYTVEYDRELHIYKQDFPEEEEILIPIKNKNGKIYLVEM